MAVVGKNFAILEAGYLRSSGFGDLAGVGRATRARAATLQNRFRRPKTQWFWSYLSGNEARELISEGPRSSASIVVIGPGSHPLPDSAGWLGLAPVDAFHHPRRRRPHRSSCRRL